MDNNLNSHTKTQRETAIRGWLIAKLSEWSAIDAGKISIQESFASYGLSSVAALSLAGDLQEWLGIELSPILVYDYPTIESLACHLADELELAQKGV
jgi:acyl carrier protein